VVINAFNLYCVQDFHLTLVLFFYAVEFNANLIEAFGTLPTEIGDWATDKDEGSRASTMIRILDQQSAQMKRHMDSEPTKHRP
jgi:hypothetical protein